MRLLCYHKYRKGRNLNPGEAVDDDADKEKTSLLKISEVQVDYRDGGALKKKINF